VQWLADAGVIDAARYDLPAIDLIAAGAPRWGRPGMSNEWTGGQDPAGLAVAGEPERRS
jgi:hypothetical protein